MNQSAPAAIPHARIAMLHSLFFATDTSWSFSGHPAPVAEAGVTSAYNGTRSYRDFEPLAVQLAIKGCAARAVGHYFCPQKCGCSSVVEHLLAKEDVASSSLVTRSSLRLERSEKRRLERARRSLAKAGRPSVAIDRASALKRGKILESKSLAARISPSNEHSKISLPCLHVADGAGLARHWPIAHGYPRTVPQPDDFCRAHSQRLAQPDGRERSEERRVG